MRRLLILLGVLSIAVFAYAAQNDYWTAGWDNTNDVDIIRLDSAGELKPGKDDNNDLGTSTLEWKDLHLDGTANIDTLAADDATLTAGSIGTLTATTSANLKIEISSKVVLTNIATSSEIIPTSSYIVLKSTGYIVGSGLAMNITATPSISTGSSYADGQHLYLQNFSTHSIVLQDDDTLADSELELGASTRALDKQSDIIHLMYNATRDKWCEVSFSSND